MHIVKYFREENREKILEFVRQNDFATLVAYDGERPVASHLLMEIVEEEQTLFVNGHMSRANPLWKMFEKSAEVLVIFQGPHTYISANWYNHVNVPTWNYQSVHVYGKPRLITDHAHSYAILKRLVDRYESSSPYKLETLPQDFVAKEIKGIAAFQIEVTKIEASYKLSQNRSDEDYWNIVDRLQEREDDLSHEVAEAMKENRATRLGSST
jgi:transcriptional regulator